MTKCPTCNRPYADATETAMHDAIEDTRDCPTQAGTGKCWCEDLCWADEPGGVCPHWLQPAAP